MRTKGIVFDLDGTLVNTLADLTAAMNHALTHFGLPSRTEEQCRMMIGNGGAAFALRAVGHDKQSCANQVLQLMRLYYEGHCVDRSCVYEGVADVITRLTNRGISMAVVTNKDQHTASRVVEHFFDSKSFVRILGAGDNISLKPDPAATLGVIRDMDLAPEDVAFVGDSDVDVMTAINAGLRPIGVSWGFRNSEWLIDAGADIVVQRPEELLDLPA